MSHRRLLIFRLLLFFEIAIATPMFKYDRYDTTYIVGASVRISVGLRGSFKEASTKRPSKTDRIETNV